MAILENNTIWIRHGRLSFPDVIVPKTQTHDDGNTSIKYGANIIMTPDQPEYAEIGQIAMAVATLKWGEQAAAVMQMINADKKLRCYGPGEEKVSQKTFKPYDGYVGMVAISGTSDNKPQLMGIDAKPLPPTANFNELFNGGNYVDAIYKLWAQDNKHGKAIRAELIALQFVEKGESFGEEVVDATSIFQQVAGAPDAATAAAAAAGGITMPGMPGAAVVDPLA